MMQASVILIVLIILAYILSSGVFIQPTNLLNILRQNTMLLIVVLAEFLVILTGGIDLSLGAVVAFSSVIVVLFQGYGLGLALVMALAGGLLIGLLNGMLITYLRLPAFVITLAMQQIVYSVAKVMTNGAKIEHSLNGAMLNMRLTQLYKQDLFGVSVPIWFCVGMVLLVSVYMHTKYGYYIYAIGGNDKAARMSGLPVKTVRIMAYVLSGLFSALAGFLFVSRVGTGDPDTGTLLSMDAIAACTIGGTSLAGGKGNVSGTVIGLLVLCVLNNVMSLVHVSPNIQPLVKGLVILIAVYMNNMKSKGDN